jgi:hypothetical protein
MGALQGAVRATGEMASWLLLATLWPVLHVVSLIRPAPFPPWLTPILEGPLRRRLQNPEQCVEQSGLAPGLTALEVGPARGTQPELPCVNLAGPDGSSASTSSWTCSVRCERGSVRMDRCLSARAGHVRASGVRAPRGTLQL